MLLEIRFYRPYAAFGIQFPALAVREERLVAGNDSLVMRACAPSVTAPHAPGLTVMPAVSFSALMPAHWYQSAAAVVAQRGVQCELRERPT